MLILFAFGAMMRSLDPCKKTFHPSAQKHRQPQLKDALSDPCHRTNAMCPPQASQSIPTSDGTQDALREREGNFSEAKVAEPQSSSSPGGGGALTKHQVLLGGV